MKIRVFGAFDCADCINFLFLAKKNKVKFEYIDIDDISLDIQNLCDKNNVDKIPHIQFISDKEYVIFEHIGSISEEQFHQYMMNYKNI